MVSPSTCTRTLRRRFVATPTWSCSASCGICLCVEGSNSSSSSNRLLQPFTSPFLVVCDCRAMCEDLNRFTRGIARGAARLGRAVSRALLCSLSARRARSHQRGARRRLRVLLAAIRHRDCWCTLPTTDGKPLAGRARLWPVGARYCKRIECDAKGAARDSVTVAGTSGAAADDMVELRPFDALDVFVDADRERQVSRAATTCTSARSASAARRERCRRRRCATSRCRAVARPLRAAAAALRECRTDADSVDGTAATSSPTTYTLLQTLIDRSQDNDAAQPKVRGASNTVRLWKEQKNARQAFNRVRDELTPSLADEMGDGGLLDNVEQDNAKRYAKYGVEVADEMRRTNQEHFNARKASRYRKKAKENK
jgi:hypothetical protein